MYKCIMPKTAAPYAYQLQKFVESYPDLCVQGSCVYCNVCKCNLYIYGTPHCEKHIKSLKHRKNKRNGIPRSEFLYDLCVVLCACNIPFNVLSNPALHDFWNLYMPQWPLPSESYIRKEYLPRMYADITSNIQSDLKDKKLYITVDETTDKHVNKIVNVIVRKLTPCMASPCWLIASKHVQRRTNQSVLDIVRNALRDFKINNEDVLLLVTDVTEDMIDCGKALKRECPNLKHVMCLARAFHRVVEDIHNLYPDVSGLIFKTEEVFSKSSEGRKQLKRILPNIPLPPTPISTRLGTWLQCVTYYSQYFTEIKKIVATLNPKSLEAVAASQRYFNSNNIEKDIKTIVQNFDSVRVAITSLEAENLSLVQTFRILDDVQKELETLNDVHGIKIKNKFFTVLNNNLDLDELREISKLPNDDINVTTLSSFYGYAPLTSVDVESSFFRYKNIISPSRMSLTETTKERLLVVFAYCLAVHKK